MKKKVFIGLCLFALWMAMALPALAADGLAASTPQTDDRAATEEQNGGKVGDATVSPALDILAARTDMAVATLRGNEYSFSEDVFARSLNLSGVPYITVVSLPNVADGELLIGSTRVKEGQVISAANLKMLTYVPAREEAGQASFTFSPNGASYAITCNVYVLSALNYSPTTGVANEQALTVSTHRDFVGYGKLTAYDPEGDTMTFEIVKEPSSGLVIMTDAANGEYVYLPRLGFTGSDRFCYVARDRYGNYSAMREVSVRVEVPSVSVTYADLNGREEYNAALSMTEAGIMTGVTTDAAGTTYFYPDQEVSRVEFLTMAMRSVGIGSVPTVTDTGFFDDASISGDAKGYVAAAYSMGYIKGEADEEGNLCFLPDEPITRAEAAVILRRMIKNDAPTALTPAFADASMIPAWASEAISTLSNMGILTTHSGEISPCDNVTRGQTAMMLAALRRVTE